MDDIVIYAFALVSLVAGALLGVCIQRHMTTRRIGEANELASRIVEEARKEAQAQKKEILLQGQNEIFSQKHAFEMECKDQERALKNREKKLQDISDRMEEKMALCHNSRAKDANIIQALVDRYAYGQPNHGKGTKAAPGFFYRFSKDAWQAMAIAATWLDREKRVQER